MKVIDLGSIRAEQESQREDWHGRKLSQAELNSLTWEEKEKIVMDTVVTIPIEAPELWEKWSGVPAELFSRWKMKVDHEKFGRPINLFGMNKEN